MTSKRRYTREEAAFLPAALEVLETPPSPIGRAVLWLVMAAAAAALLWASLAQVDIVAVAEGRVVPRARLQTVEAPEPGIVRAIAVEEGMRVVAGQVLVSLDPTVADADAEASRTELATAALARARAEALLAYAAGRAPVLLRPEGSNPAAFAAEQATVAARIAALEERLAGVESRIAGADAARRAAIGEMQGAAETIPLAQKQFEARRALEAEGFAAPMLNLREEERLIALRRTAEARAAEADQAAAEIETLMRERAQARAEFRAQAAAEKAEAEAIVATRSEGVRRAEFRTGNQRLTAPMAGIVHEVAVRSLGEVVEAGAPLVTIVPQTPGCDGAPQEGPQGEECAGDELIVEAMVLNRDVGFIAPGQRVVVKLEAYPFTRHGHLEGEVEQLSPDAIADEARGLVFPARVKILSSRLREVNGWTAASPNGTFRQGRKEDRMGDPGRVGVGADVAPIASMPAGVVQVGIAAQVEIITGRRSVLSYVLSPIARARDEAGRER